MLPLFNEDGQPHGYLNIMRDGTGTRIEAERRALVETELIHRVKNTFFLAQAVAVRSQRYSTTPEAFLDAFADRLKALSRSHEMLVHAAMMNLHLAEISAAVTPGAHAVLTIDGAGWHQVGDKLMVPPNITSLHLPPYSPEPNPVENVWAYLPGNKLSNRVFDTYNDIVEACCDAWNWLTAQPERITSIASRTWATVNP